MLRVTVRIRVKVNARIRVTVRLKVTVTRIRVNMENVLLIYQGYIYSQGYGERLGLRYHTCKGLGYYKVT